MLNAQWHEAQIFRRFPRDAAAQRIADDIRRRIVGGDLPVHTTLPSMRKLSAWYAVSLPTVQAAIHVLRATGRVRVVPGAGTFVAQPSWDEATGDHAWLRATWRELRATRYSIDSQMATLAALRVARSGGQGARLPATIADLPFLAAERLYACHSWPEVFLRADAAFHRAVASSVPGFEITTAINDRVLARLQPALMDGAERQRLDRRLSSLHLALADAIRDGRAIEATRLARQVARRELRSLRGVLG